MRNFIKRQWFLLSLAILFGIGLAWHRELRPLAELTWLRSGTVALAMFLMALPLEAKAIGATLRRPGAVFLAVFVSYGLLPIAAWLVRPLLLPDYGNGLLVAAITPCTMASATVWTRKAGGNDTAATVVTVVTNLICFVVTPAWLYVFTGREQSASLHEFWAMVQKLTLTVVLPIVAAQLVRLHPLAAQWSMRRKFQLSLASQVCILFMVMIGAVQSGEKLTATFQAASGWGSLLAMIVAVLSVHLTMFWAGMALAKGIGLVRGDQIAVGFAGSQKTLMVGMQVSMDSGFSVLPMVAYHIGQLFVDTVLADRIRKNDEARMTRE